MGHCADKDAAAPVVGVEDHTVGAGCPCAKHVSPKDRMPRGGVCESRDAGSGRLEVKGGGRCTLTASVVSRRDDGELLVGAGGVEGEALAVVEAVGVLAGADLLVVGVEAAALGDGLVDLLAGVLGVAAADGAEAGGALALFEGDGVGGGEDGAEGQGEGGFEADHGGWDEIGVSCSRCNGRCGG